jgi:hypothetical protein
MAFNPFHRFRKHQKAIFAVLAIICMFVFILQFASGRGDPLNRMIERFGLGRARGDMVTTLYGKKVHEGDLQTLTQQRQAASDFLQFVSEQAHSDALRENSAIFTKGDDQQLASLLTVYFQASGLLRTSGLPRGEALFKEITQWLRQASGMQSILETFAKQPEKAKAVKTLVRALEYLAWKYDPKLPKDDLYFGGTTNREDLLDFMVWQHQADKLGISLDEEAIIKQINQEAGGRDVLEGKKFADEPLVRAFLINRKSRAVANSEDLLNALREEFRVALAQEALVGVEAGARAYRSGFAQTPSPHQVPAAGTPDEFLKYYRDQRTTLNVGLLPVAVKDFVSRVEAQPTEEDLRRLYERYKSQEPVPDRREPGFKKPRRIKVEYVTAKVDSPLYRKLADRGLTIQEQLLRFASPLTTPAGGGAGWAAAAAAPFLLPPEPELYPRYETYREQIRPWNDPFRLTPSELHDSSIQRPENAASTVAQLLGSAGTGGSVLSAPATFMATGTMAEVRDSLKFHVALLMSNPSPTPFTAFALVEPFTPKVLPLDVVKPQLREKVVDELAPQFAEANLRALGTELNKLKAKPAEARAFLEKLKEKDIFLDSPIVSTDKLETVYTVADDPKLKPFKEAYEKFRDNNAQGPMAGQLPDFAHRLFAPPGAYDAQFAVFSFTGPTTDPYLFWLSENEKAEEQPFNKVRSEVEAAWKLQEARPLAVAEAERIKKELLDKKLTIKDDIEKFLTDQKQGKPVYLNNVARLVPIRSALPGRTEYERYRPPASEVPHPPLTFVRQLLALEKPGDAVVLKDAPEKTVYVAVLLVPRDDRRNFKEFADLYEKTPDGDSLYQSWFMEDRRREFRRRVLEQLRAEAGALDAEGRFVVNENLKNRGESSEPLE